MSSDRTSGSVGNTVSAVTDFFLALTLPLNTSRERPLAPLYVYEFNVRLALSRTLNESKKVKTGTRYDRCFDIGLCKIITILFKIVITDYFRTAHECPFYLFDFNVFIK